MQKAISFLAGIGVALLAVFLIMHFSGPGEQPPVDTSNIPPEIRDGLVTLKPPYSDERSGVESQMDVISLGQAVRALCIQVGMRYNSKQSALYISPTDERWIQPDFENTKWEDAMKELLAPFNLICTIENDEVVLRRPKSSGRGEDSLVRLKPPYTVWGGDASGMQVRTTVRHAVGMLCEQAGMEFDDLESYRNTGPLFSTLVRPDLDNVPWKDAVHEILAPNNLVYAIDDNKVVLAINGWDSRTPDINTPVTLKPPYSEWKGAEKDTERTISLHDAVWAICFQAGMKYDYLIKHDYSEMSGNAYLPLRRIVEPDFENIPWEKAMSELLAPMYLTYAVKDNEVTLMRATGSGLGRNSRVTLKPPYPVWLTGKRNLTGRIQIILAAESLCDQSGLGFDRNKSVQNINPLWAFGVQPDFEDIKWEDAMRRLLDPYKLSYNIENGAVSLVRAGATGKEALVTLKPPYTLWQRRQEDPTDRIRMARAVRVICAQAGFEYDSQTSEQNIGIFWKKEIQPYFENVTWEEGMDKLLRPYNLIYSIDDNTVILESTVKGDARKKVLVTLKAPYNAWDEGKRIKTDRIRLSQAIYDICSQAGFKYHWKKSADNVGPLWKMEIQPNFENTTWEEGMDRLLKPVSLTYAIEDDTVILARSGAYPEQTATSMLVTLKPPYSVWRSGKKVLAERMSVTQAAYSVCEQVGLEYNWKKSADNIDPLWRMEIQPNFENIAWEEGLKKILDPMGLTYAIEDGKVTLVVKKGVKMPAEQAQLFGGGNAPDVSRRVSLRPPFSGWNPNKDDPQDVIAVIDAVNAVCRQAGIRYDFGKSFENTKPLCNKRISPVINGEPWDSAMLDIIDPIGLAYTFEGDTVVLTRK